MLLLLLTATHAETSQKKRVRREREWVRESEASNCQACVCAYFHICVCVCVYMHKHSLLLLLLTATEWVNESRLRCCLLAKSAASFFVKACIRSRTHIHTWRAPFVLLLLLVVVRYFRLKICCHGKWEWHANVRMRVVVCVIALYVCVCNYSDSNLTRVTTKDVCVICLIEVCVCRRVQQAKQIQYTHMHTTCICMSAYEYLIKVNNLCAPLSLSLSVLENWLISTTKQVNTVEQNAKFRVAQQLQQSAV